MNTDEFLRGQRDCKNGKPHTDQSKDYNRGYAAQYEMEQALSQYEMEQELSYGGFN